MTHARRATAYAKAVTSGKVPACLYVRQAAQRHLDDLAAAKRRDFPFRFDADAVNRVCAFIELMPHTKGRWAQNGEHIVLEDWQCFVVGVPFGWKRKDTGARRFRRTYVEVPRKNAKSTTTAALGLYMFAADGEHGAEVYSGATTEKQAWEVFGPARLMAKKTPEFQAAYGVQVGAKNLSILETASKFGPVIGKPGDGASPSFSITDEYHEHDTEEQYDTFVTGMGARDQPMAWVITTAGIDTSGPCYALRQEVIEVLSGAVSNDRLWGIVYTIDEGDDWSDPDVLRKANPNFDVSVSGEYLLSQQRDAINNPRKQSTFKTKHLNVWTGAAAPYFNIELWNRLADAPPVDEFAGETCFAGLDLASKIDVAAYVRLFRREIDGAMHYYAYGTPYVPEERALDPDKRAYQEWVATGDLTATPGDITDYDYIEADIKADAECYGVELGVDPHNATQLITHLMHFLGDEHVSEVPQTVLHLSEPMKEIQALIVDGRIHHDGNRANAWMLGHVTAQEDRNENVFPRKEKPENKIDFAVALMDAMSVALRFDPPLPSRWENDDAGVAMV